MLSVIGLILMVGITFNYSLWAWIRIRWNEKKSRLLYKIGVIIHNEQRHIESQIQYVIDDFNVNSVFLVIDPVYIITSINNTMLR